MRLWHYKLILHLPRQQLLGQHRECCALRGLGWGKKHSTVDYIFKYNYLVLFLYHEKVMRELILRNYKVRNKNWWQSNYRGRNIGFVHHKELPNIKNRNILHYLEHNDEYLQECLNNLKNKGIEIKESKEILSRIK